MSRKYPTTCDACGVSGNRHWTIRNLAPLGTGRRTRLCPGCHEEALREDFGLPDGLPWPRCGGVYFIQPYDDPHGLIKIGSSDYIPKRLESLRNQCPVRLRLLGYIDERDLDSMENGTTFENQLHRRFVLYRQHGEWFQPNMELLTYIHWLRRGALGVEYFV